MRHAAATSCPDERAMNIEITTSSGATPKDHAIHITGVDMKAILTTIFKTVLITLVVLFTLMGVGVGLFHLAHQADKENLPIVDQRPSLPISVSYRQAFFGPGAVAIFHNDSGQVIEVEATLSSPANRYARLQLVIPSYGQKEIGPLDGWDFVTGQHIELENSNYRSLELAVR